MATDPSQSIEYWQIVSESLSTPIYMSGVLPPEKALIMADALSRDGNCIVVLQKRRQHGDLEPEVIWQRYVINGLDSFRDDSAREANRKKKAKVRKGHGLRRTEIGEGIVPKVPAE